jgi:DNA mismatch repair protein MSH3
MILMLQNLKMSVAYAVLQHLIMELKCKTLFVTHYPLVATELERKFPIYLQNMHLGYDVDNRVDGKRDITFLYRLTPAIASESFGVECARLAGLPESVLDVAASRSKALQGLIEDRSKRNK